MLIKEKEATHALDALAAERRRLPMVEFGTDYVFATGTGEATLLELFQGCRQLVVYQFMDNGPDDYCPGCTTYTDNTDSATGRPYIYRRDTAYVTISDMPIDQFQAYAKRRGWVGQFYSSHGTTFQVRLWHRGRIRAQRLPARREPGLSLLPRPAVGASIG